MICASPTHRFVEESLADLGTATSFQFRDVHYVLPQGDSVLISCRQLITFDNWTIFSKLLARESDAELGVFLYEQAINAPTSPLHIYTSPMTSTDFDFITCLTITASFTIPDLLKLSSIKNLGILELVQPPSERSEDHEVFANVINDRLIRTWAESASSDKKAFPLLRVLRFVGCSFMSASSLKHVNSFPALALLDLEGFDLDILAAIEIADQVGWKQIQPDKLHSARGVPILFRSDDDGLPADEISTWGNLQSQANIQTEIVSESETKHVLSRRFSTYLDFVAIGRKRDNGDLQEIGLHGASKTFHGQAFSSIPTAVMRLGPENQVRNRKRMIFTRFDYGKMRQQQTIPRKTAATSKPERVRDSVRKGKRQKLDAVMEMFQ